MDIEVARGEYTRWREIDDPTPELDDGDARLRIDRFGFSSNNVTYAVMGDLLRYWEAFPAGPADAGDTTAWGRVPVWGFAEVVETRSPHVSVGERLFGFLPMSTELVITPGRANAAEVTDTAVHRAVLAGPYNTYRRCLADPSYRADTEELQMLLFPLFVTSFVIDDFLADNGDFGAGQAVVSSASAKTSSAAAHLLHARGVRTVGLTSPGNVGFCRSLGVYDEVVTYDAVATLDRVPSVFLDVSGDQSVVSAVHRRLEGELRHSMIVGDTHWDSAPAEGEGPLPGPAPAFLFAPTQITKRSREWGRDVLARRMADAWSAYADWAAGWIVLDGVSGPAAVVDVFRTYLAGRLDPRVGTVCTLYPGEASLVKFGIVFANTGPFVDPSAAVAMARAAESAGFESLWTVEHTVVPAGYESTYPYDPSGRMPGSDDSPIPDPLVWLAFLASATTSINLATGILIQPQRNPVVLAKEVATLDHLSGGRMLLGIGVGWLEEEFDAIGVPFAERGRRTDDGVAAMRALWSQDQASYDGEFTSFTECICRPQPVRGTVPIHVGGHSEIAARRAGRIGDGYFPASVSHRGLAERLVQMRESAEAAGRDPGTIEITCGGNGVFGPNALDEAAALAELGVDRIVVPSFLFWKGTDDTVAAYGDEVIARV